jgi:hypothetical protein
MKNRYLINSTDMMQNILKDIKKRLVQSLKINNVLFLFLLYSTEVSAQTLNGTYTIGGDNPDFTTLNQAVTRLNTFGVAGPVTFNIRPGRYTEQIKISQYPNSSNTSMVVFQSESGNPNDVVLNHTHTILNGEIDNFTVYINGADNLTFRNMTIQANQIGQDLSRVVYMIDDCNNIRLENNVIKSWYQSLATVNKNECIYIGMTYQNSADNDSLYIKGNTIIGGSVGLYIEGVSTDGNFYTTNWTIEDNKFLDQKICGLSVHKGMNTKISGNSFELSKLPPSYTAIYLDIHSDSLTIDGNYCNIPGGGYGIWVSNIKSGIANYKRVSNNVIIIGEKYISGNLYGIYSTKNDSLLLAHNTVLVNSPTNQGYVVCSTISDTLLLYNNQFIHNGGGFCYYSIDNLTGVFKSDYNNLYNSGQPLAMINGVPYQNLMEIRTNLNRDLSSVSIDPMFPNKILLMPMNAMVQNNGMPLSAVPIDFFGNNRSQTTPDIGAYEVDIAASDASVVYSSILNYPKCPDSSIPIYVKIKNYGMNTLNSVNIMYKTSETSVQSIPWIGNLSQFQESDSLFLGNISFPKSGLKELKIWTENPNNTVDAIKENDTLMVQMPIAMNGSYIVGDDPTADFLKLIDAVESLEICGVCGPVTINILPGTYIEQVSINPINGTSPVNNITIQSANQDSSSVTIKYYTTNVACYIIKLNGANYIHIKYLTLHSIGYDYQNAIHITYGASYNKVSNSVISAVFNCGNSGSKALLVIGGGTLPLHDNIIKQNVFIEGNDQFYANTNGYGNQVVENIFKGAPFRPITARKQNGILISKNIIEETTFAKSNTKIIELYEIANYSFQPAMNIDDCYGSIIVEKNNIYGTIRGKTISITNSTGTTDNPITVRNNFLIGKSYIVEMENSSNVRIINNSIKILSNDVMIMYRNNVSNITLFNNIFNCPNGSFVYSSPTDIDTSNFHSDYNVFYPINTSKLLVYDTLMNLDSWRNVYGQDMHSVASDPQFTTDLDMHINNASALDGHGTSLPDVPDDIDDAPRSLSIPDIGADEFNINYSTYRDLELVRVVSPDTTLCSALDSLIIEVANHSQIPIYSFTVKWWLFGLQNDSVVKTITIPSGDTVNVNVGGLRFIPNSYYELIFELSKPDAQADNYFNNNTKSVNFDYLGNVQIYQQPNTFCNNEHVLFIRNFNRSSVLWSTGATGNKITVTTPGIYSVTVIGENGCEVTDSIEINE